MALSNKERAFIQRYTTRLTALADICRELEQLRLFYVSTGFSFIDDDLAEFGITAAALGDGLNLIDELNNKFLKDDPARPVSTGDWQGILDRARVL